MIASLVRFLLTFYEESQTHSFAALTRLASLGVVIGQNSALQWEGRERGERKGSDKWHTPAILDTKSPQTPLFVYFQATLSFYGHIIFPNLPASKNLPEEQMILRNRSIGSLLHSRF